MAVDARLCRLCRTHFLCSQTGAGAGGMSASKIIVPVVLGAAFLIIWEMLVRLYAVPLYVLPPPTAIAAALTANFSSLMEALWNTLTITLEASIVALIAGVTLAVLFSQSRILERAL